MSGANGEPNTEDLLLLAGPDSFRARGDAGAVTGRARPVVSSDSQLETLWESDDPSVIQSRFAQDTVPGVPAGEAPTHRRLALLITRGVAGVTLAVFGMLVVALMIVLAVR